MSLGLESGWAGEGGTLLLELRER